MHYDYCMVTMLHFLDLESYFLNRLIFEQQVYRYLLLFPGRDHEVPQMLFLTNLTTMFWHSGFNIFELSPTKYTIYTVFVCSSRVCTVYVNLLRILAA